jgi:spermidine/putrescine transport system substrate-binding protein
VSHHGVGLLGHRLTRRQLLEIAGKGSLAGYGGWLLAACGLGGAGRESPRLRKLPPLAHELVIAQWPLYIDKATVPGFEDETDIDVRYREVIADNQEFFAVIQDPLAAGQPTGWDLVALSDWVVAKMNRLGWLEPLHWDLLPTVDRNLSEIFRNPPYDPRNAHSVPWQGGITGIGYNRQLTGRDLSTVEDLWDPAFAGHVGMLTEMVDTMNLTLLMLGTDPEQATVDDAEKAQQKLLEQREAGIVRGYFGNDYIDGLSTGNLWATMAWSGDIFWLKRDNPDLEFVVPVEGGLLWATPLEIPREAAHPRDAHVFLDYVYRPEVAADITEWVGYITPNSAVEDVLLQRADEAKNQTRRRFLEDLASSPFVFPTPEMRSNLHTYKILSEEEERTWNDLFEQVVQG